MSKTKIMLISTGGTITMTPGSTNGVVPTLSGKDLVAAVPALEHYCNLDVVSYSTKPGGSLTFEELIDISQIIQKGLDAGADGAIIVQGTDTIEETAFVFDLLINSEKPVVVTGAMRSASAISADGPANLLSAVLVASSKEVRQQGTLVVLNDEIHAARYVRKNDTANVAAFMSSGCGPLGRVAENHVLVYSSLKKRPPVLLPQKYEHAPVALVKVGLGDDGRLLEAIPGLHYSGVIIEAMGAGHLPSLFGDIVGKLCNQLPVVLATRVPQGPLFSQTYSFIGSEMDILERGAIYSGSLGSLRARILLSLLLSAGFSGEELRSEFAKRA